MASGSAVRNQVAQWLFNELWTFSELPPDAVRVPMAKAMLVCANGDGELADAERNWVLGYCAALDYSDAQLEEIRNYDAKEDIRTVLAATDITNRPDVKMAAIYEAIRASGADGVLAEGEVSTIIRMGNVLGVSEQTVRDMVGAYRAEVAARDNRIKLIFGQGRPY